MQTYARQPLGGWRNETCLIPIDTTAATPLTMPTASKTLTLESCLARISYSA